MKFVAQQLSKCTSRLGVLNEIENLSSVVIETPMPMLYTRGGSIPHITNEVFKMIKQGPQIIQIPLVSTYNFQDAMSYFGNSISEFVGMKDCISCMTVQDPGDLTLSGHHCHGEIPLWTRSGKTLINSERYMDAMEKFKPDMYFILSDGDTNITSSAKRLKKAVDHTLKYFNECIQRHESSQVLKNTFVMAAVAGGYCLKERTRCLDKIAKNDLVGGFLIDGLHNNGPEVEFLAFKEIKPVVEFVVENLPPEKLRVIQGCWSAVTVLDLVQLGIDIFDTSYCHIVTERSAALTFSLDLSDKHNVYEINLRQPQYSDDFQPILPGCTCLTCVNHSRSYIYHLITVQELLGPLLLNIHNLHHYVHFFKSIRQCITEGTLHLLKAKIAKEFKQHQELTTGYKYETEEQEVEQ